jgi:phosphatase NudJ
MAREAIPSWFFALVVVRRGDRFLLVRERKYGSPWAIPGGRVERGEQLAEAAVREVHEEAGVPVVLTGIYRVEHAPTPGGARVRVIFAGEPIGDTPPKTTADAESLGAAYLTLDEIRARPVRGAELIALLESVAAGRPVYPMDLIGRELAV